MVELEDKLIRMDLVKQCAISHYGEELLLEMGHRTDSLEPKQTLIPWITFNGVSMLLKIQLLFSDGLYILVNTIYRNIILKIFSRNLIQLGKKKH